MGAIISGFISKKKVPDKDKIYCIYKEYKNGDRYADLHWYGLIPVK